MTTEGEALAVYWATERENIRKRRAEGLPREQWTTDPIFQKGRFCNARREDDRTTIWIRENWRAPHADDSDLFFAMALARLVNRIETLAKLDYPAPWSP